MVEIVIPMIVAFCIVHAMGPKVVPFLLKLKIGNTEREYIESHKAKNGTPSMGGIMFLIAFTIVSVIYGPSHPHMWPILIMTLAFGAIGFVDDFLKVVKKDKDGFKPKQKFICEILVTVGFAVYMFKFSDVGLAMMLPITGKMVDIGFLSVVVLFIAVLGTVNGANFTDGLDGLATTVTIVITMFLLACSMKFGSDCAPATAAMMGGLFGFLLMNCHPAKVFMGDTGSLAIGAFVITTAYMLNMPIFVIIVAFIYLLEVVSVILQVGYFKLTHGKRIFRMAPIHHHYELGGWSEVKIVNVFSVVTALLCFIAYYLIG